MRYSFLISCLLLSCVPTVKHKSFNSNPSKALDGNMINQNQLRLNGSYYRIRIVIINNQQQYCLHYFFLFENAIAAEGSFCQTEKLPNNVLAISNKIKEDFSQEDKSEAFGGYKIDGRSVTIQIFKYFHWLVWSPTLYKGNIVNNNSFLINKRYNKEWKINAEESDLYNFIEMEKPDSLQGNKWKNKKWYWQNG